MARSDRSRINSYARSQEDRMEERFIEMGFVLIEDTGRRTNKYGDRILKHPDTGLLVVADHKSTQNKESFTITKAQLAKIKKEAWHYDRAALPLLTFGFKGATRMYAIIDLADMEGVMY